MKYSTKVTTATQGSGPKAPDGPYIIGRMPSPPQNSAPSGPHPLGNLPSSVPQPGIKPGRS